LKVATKMARTICRTSSSGKEECPILNPILNSSISNFLLLTFFVNRTTNKSLTCLLVCHRDKSYKYTSNHWFSVMLNCEAKCAIMLSGNTVSMFTQGFKRSISHLNLPPKSIDHASLITLVRFNLTQFSCCESSVESRDEAMRPCL